jgi:hypothetical protein
MKTFDSITIGHTSKGRRVWLQTLEEAGWPPGTGYTVAFSEDAITLTRDPESKRRVVASKRGVIDLVSKKVTVWTGTAERATVAYCGDTIVIKRETEA